MYFLETIEGTKGEKFTSAILKYLFINSDGFRRLFLKRIQRYFAASALLSFKDGVICKTEVPTDSGDGFIDLVLFGDNGVLGIENKLWAEIQDDQPGKYLKTLEQRAESRNPYKIVMLAPSERMEDIEKELNKQGIPREVSICLSWQDVMEDLTTLVSEESGEVKVVAAAFHEYLKLQVEDVLINALQENLVGKFVVWNDYHVDFLNKVWRVFDNAGRIVSGGSKGQMQWYGFYFTFEKKRIEHWKRPWFGFCTDKAGSAVSLVVQTHCSDFARPNESFTLFEPATSTADVWFKVLFDEKVSSVPKWKEKLKPLFEQMRQRFDDVPSDESDV